MKRVVAVLGIVLILSTSCVFSSATYNTGICLLDAKVNNQSVNHSVAVNQPVVQNHLSQMNLQSDSLIQANESFGGSDDDYFNSIMDFSSSTENYLLAGSTKSYGAGGEDIWILEMIDYGGIYWNFTFGGSQNDAGYDVVSGSGIFMVTGYTESFGAGLSDVWLVGFDGYGHIWNKTFGGSHFDIGYAAIGLSNGFLVAGVTYSFGAGNSDFWLIRVDGDGNHLWNHTYGGAGYERPFAVTECEDGGFAILGFTTSFGSGGQDMWLVRTNSTGDVLWSSTYGGPEDEEGWGLTECGDGGFALTGYTASYGAGSWDMWLVRTNSTGHLEWSNTYGDTLSNFGKTVIGGVSGCFVIFGSTFTNNDNFDFWLVIANSDGEFVWSENYGGSSLDRGEAMIHDGNELVMVGYTHSYDGGFANGWVLRVTPPMLWVDEPVDVVLEYAWGRARLKYYYFTMGELDQWWFNNPTLYSLDYYPWERHFYILLSGVGVYDIEVGINDTLGFTATASFQVTIQDTTPPVWVKSPRDITMQRYNNLTSPFLSFDAQDCSGVEYRLTGEEASIFTIREQSGICYLSYNLALVGYQHPPADVYSFEVNAVDPYNNTLTKSITVTILESSRPVNIAVINPLMIPFWSSIAGVVILAVFIRWRKSKKENVKEL